MKIDFTKPVLDLDDKPIEVEGKSGTVFTLKSACTQALMAQQPGAAAPLSIDESMAKYLLALKIHKSSAAIDLKAEEVVLLKRNIAGVYGPLIVGRACEMLENPTPASRAG